MYPPPQSAALNESTNDLQRHSTDQPRLKSHFKAFSHSHPAPFAYEYIVEDGKMPFLAELHPMKTKDLKQTESVQETLIHSRSSSLRRDSSLKRKERHPQFDLSASKATMPTFEKTTDKLKRAFSLSGLKSSSSSRHSSVASSNHKQLSSPARNDSTRSAPPAITPPVPSLILPTPSPSPDLGPIPDFLRNSMHSHSTFRSLNSSLPRSSWASETDEEDLMDLHFVRETAQGRFSPNPTPVYGLRRNKALAILGITDMPLTPPYSPSHSAAPSIYDHSREDSRRASVEHRLSQLVKDDKPLPNYPSLPEPTTPARISPSTPEGDKTPKAPALPTRPQVKEQSPTDTTPRPALKRKTSRFIEHIDITPEKTSFLSKVTLPRTQFLFSSDQAASTFPLTVPILPPPTRPLPPSPGLRRSESMRTPSPRASSSVVCMAEARPIVAVGTARLITS
jgi:hypothetical protein